MYKSAFVAFTALAVAQARLVHMRRQDIAAPSNTLPDIPPRTNWTTDASAALVKREDNWLDPEHCPGGSIGDAISCSWQPETLFTTPVMRWKAYGSKQSNCNAPEGVTLSTAVADSYTVGNSWSESSSVSIGASVEAEGVGASVGFTASWEESWSVTSGVTNTQTLLVPSGTEGNMLTKANFYLSRGRLRIRYTKKSGGHYIWYANGLERWSQVPGQRLEYASDVGPCPHGGTDSAWWYDVNNFNEAVNGEAIHVKFPENSDDPHCGDVCDGTTSN